MKMTFTHRIYQFALLSAILACCSAAFAEEVTLTARTYPTDVGKNGLPAGKTYCDLTADDLLIVTQANAQLYLSSSADLVVPIVISGNATGSEKTGKFRLQEAGTVVNINGPVTLAGNTAVGAHTNNSNGKIYFNNQITGSGAFIIGSGTGVNVYFSNETTNANNYAGNTQIGENGMYINPASGFLNLGANEQIPNGSGKGNLVMLNSSVLNMNSFTETVNGLVSTSASTSINGSGKLILGDNNATASYAGNVTGSLAVEKIGSGTQTLSGTNSYNGGTTINAGTLILGENGSLGSGNVSVAQDATLGIQTQQGSTKTWDGGTISGSGTLKVTGGGTFSITPVQMQIANDGSLIADGANIILNNSADANGNYSGAEIYINNGGSVTFSRSGSKDQFWISNQTTITFGESGGGTLNAGGNNTINLVNNSQTQIITKGGATNFVTGASGFNLHSQNITFDVAKGTDPNENDLVFSARLWNGKGIVKNGEGTLVISSEDGATANNFAGGTTINKGAVRLTNNGILGTGAVAVGADGSLEFAYSEDKSFTNAISGSGKIVKTGDNKVSFTGANTFTGDVDIQGGTLSTLINGTNKNLNITKLSGSGDLELRMASGSSDAKLPNLTNDGFTGNISLVLEGAASNTKINTNSQSFEGFTFKVNPGTSIFVAGAEFKADVLLSGTGNSENRGAMRIANNFSGDLTVMADANVGIDGTRTVSGNITSGADSGEVTLFINGKTDGTTVTANAGPGTFTGSVSDGDSGSKLGINVVSNTQTFSGELSYSGPTTIKSGATMTLIGDGANLAASRAAVVNGTLNFTDYTGESAMTLNNLTGSGAVTGTDKNLILNNDTATTYTGTINIGTGTITKDGSGKLTIQGAAGRLTASAYTINDGVLSIESANLIGTAPSVNVAQSGTLSLKFDSGSATRFDATNLSGAGVLEMALYNGTGNTYLDNLNTTNFTGVVSLVQGGARNGNKLNTSTLAYEGVTFIVNPDTTLFAAGNFKGDVILYGMGNSENRGALRVSNTVSGDITVMTDTLIGCDWGANTTYHVDSDIVAGAESGEVTVQLKTTGDTAMMDFSGSISDGDAGAALGFRVLSCVTPHVFSGDLSYTGATTLDSGSGLKLTGDGANLVNSRDVVVNGALDFAGYTGESAMKFNNLTGTNGAITGGNNDLILNIEKDTAYSGTIQIGTGTLTKSGIGNLKLLGPNDGDLVASTFNVDAGRLDVKEFFTGKINVNPTAILSPGNSIGTLRVNGDFALDGGTLLMEIGGPTAADSDQLFVSGNLSLTDDSSILLQLTDGFSLAPNAPFEVILDAANSESVIDNVLSSIDSYYFSGLTYGLNADGYWAIMGHVDPNAVPEPSTWALLILGAFGLALARRFQKRSK